MEHLKEGDWVRDGENIYKFKKPSSEYSYQKSLRTCKLWTPNHGEWVIPDTGINEDMFVVMKYNGVSLIPNRCQPFIGELPSNLKE